MNILKVASIQMDVALGEPERNREKADKMLSEAARLGCQLAVLPELWSTGYTLDRLPILLPDSASEDAMSSWAQTHRMFLLGSLAEKEEQWIYNSLHVYGPDGALLGKYRKIHLFAPMEEDRLFSPGLRPVVLSLPFARTGLAICYDLRFPDLFQSLALAGAEILVTVAEWPSIRVDHWRILVQARAIESQAFCIACNRVGRDLNSIFGGHSLVVSPWGLILAEGGEEEAVVTAELNLEEVAEVRSKIPVLREQKLAAARG